MSSGFRRVIRALRKQEGVFRKVVRVSVRGAEKQTLAEALHLEMTFRSHTRRDAAEALGVSIRTLHGWLAGVKPRSNSHPALAGYLGQEIDSFLKEDRWPDEGRGGRRSSKRRR